MLVPEEQLKKLEVIIVNDGTPDRSAEMARECEKRYPDTFRVIDKENGGHGSAWNRGLKEATGKYLRFLDSDDWFDTDEFSRLILHLDNMDADVVLSHYNWYDVQTDKLIKHTMFIGDRDKSFTIQDFEWENLGWERFNFWGCTYRTAILQKEYPLFLEGVFYDDAILFIAPVYLCKTFDYFNATIYNYLVGRPGQTMAPDVKRKHLDFWARTHFHVFDFGIGHCNCITDQRALDYVTAFFKEWIHDALVQFSAAPYSQAKLLTQECLRLYERLQESMPGQDLSTKTIRACQKLPYPLFFALRHVLKVFRTE